MIRQPIPDHEARQILVDDLAAVEANGIVDPLKDAISKAIRLLDVTIAEHSRS